MTALATRAHTPQAVSQRLPATQERVPRTRGGGGRRERPRPARGRVPATGSPASRASTGWLRCGRPRGADAGGCRGAAAGARALGIRRGTPFWAYASWWVRQGCSDSWRSDPPVVLSDARCVSSRASRRPAASTSRREGHEPVDGPRRHDGLHPGQVENLIAVERTPRALEEPIGDGDDADATFGDLLADPVAEDAYERVDRRVEIEGLRELPNDLVRPGAHDPARPLRARRPRADAARARRQPRSERRARAPDRGRGAREAARRSVLSAA